MRKVPLAGALKHEIYRYLVDLHWMSHEAKRWPPFFQIPSSDLLFQNSKTYCRAYTMMIPAIHYESYQLSWHTLKLKIWNKSIFTFQRNIFFYLVKSFKGTLDSCLSRFSSRKWESIIWLYFISATFAVKKSRRNSAFPLIRENEVFISKEGFPPPLSNVL